MTQRNATHVFRAFTGLVSKLPGRETTSKDVHKASNHDTLERYDPGFVFTLSGDFKRVITRAAFHSLGKYPSYIRVNAILDSTLQRLHISGDMRDMGDIYQNTYDAVL